MGVAVSSRDGKAVVAPSPVATFCVAKVGPDAASPMGGSKLWRGGARRGEEFNDACVPAGDVGGDLFEDRDGTFALAVVDGVGDIEALAARVEAVDEVGGDETDRKSTR